MNAYSSPNSTSDEQAALWAARLEGSSLGETDRAALDAWLDQDPTHRPLLSQYCQFSADLEEQLPVLAMAGRVEMPVDKKPSRPLAKIGWFAATSLAAAAAIATAFWPAKPEHDFRNLATPVAQRGSITLADGTHVELNARTSLTISSNGAERYVRLADGEAFFEVSRDRSRPFIVETPAGSIRVTGTKFNVHVEQGLPFEVTVMEGSVQVRPIESSGAPASAPYSLGARDRLVADADGVAVRSLSSSAVENTLAWRQGQVVFDGTPLREALARFARYHGRGITSTPAAASLEVGGLFSLEDLDGFFAALEEILPVHVTRDLSGTVRVDLRSSP